MAPAEQEQYLLEMLDPSNATHRAMVEEFKERRDDKGEISATQLAKVTSK